MIKKVNKKTKIYRDVNSKCFGHHQLNFQKHPQGICY